MSARRHSLKILAIAIALTSCATQRVPVEDAQTYALIGFVQPGGPTRAEVEARLGPPAQTYEGGRLVTYALEERDGRLTAMVYSGRPGYTLVIEYDQNAKIARRAIVERP